MPRYRLVRLVNAMVILIAMLAACASPQPTAAPQAPTLSAKTPKPTFTPAQPATATLVPTATSAAKVAATAVPTAESEPTPEPTAEPTAAPATPEPTEAPAATATVPAPKALRMNSPEYGMQAFVWWRPEVASRDMQVVRDAGFGWVKVNFGWRDIEGAGKGQFDWSRTDRIVQQAGEVGIDLIVRVDHQPEWAGGGYPVNGPPNNPQDLASFFSALAKRYQGRIRAYEVWNEPNLSREWGGKLPDPVGYVALLKQCYRAIKAADPNAMVISAGLSPTGSWDETARWDEWYLETMYVAMNGNSTGYFDVLGAHGAGFKSPPETDPAVVAADQSLGGNRFMCFRHVEDLHAIMVKNGEGNKQIALLEFGWTSDPRPDSPYNWHAVSEQTKADYLVRAYQYAKANWSPWIGLMSLIYICDNEWTQNDEQYWWAISDPGWPQFYPRPAYTALKAMAK
jgi:hypothetical protein